MSILSKADLLTTYADNILGLIKALTHRNMIESVLGCYGGLELVEGVTAQTVTATPTKMTGWGANALSVGVTPGFATNDITIDVDGVYDVEWFVCFSGSASDVFYVAPYVDGVTQNSPRVDRKLGTGGDVGSSSMKTRLSLSAAEVVSLFVWSDTGGTSFLPHNASFMIKRVG
jgi:hypothetical protein